MIRVLATFGLIGMVKPGPGTWGSLAAIPAAWGVHQVAGFQGLIFATIILMFAGIKIIERYVEEVLEEDPSEVVIDEVVGMWVALLPISYGAQSAGVPFTALWPGIITAFFAFRILDITKPGPIGWADRRGGPMGVMLDEVFAGALAAVLVIGIAAVAHLRGW